MNRKLANVILIVLLILACLACLVGYALFDAWIQSKPPCGPGEDWCDESSKMNGGCLMIISFGWTTSAFLAGDKTCTRRQWSPRHMAAWQKAYDQGRLIHDAWDKNPRCRGQRIGQIRLACRPYYERLADMHPDDLAAEGGLWTSIEEFITLFGDPAQEVCVVRFEPILEGV